MDQKNEWARRWWNRPWLFGVLLITATLAAYLPALHGEFIWDDDSWTTKIAGLLHDFSGLWSMWNQPSALQQYYPLTGTSFWLDYQLWEFWTVPYHVENVLVHVLGALLFWRLLWRLQVPGARLAAAIFALHPVMVESAAWVTERKNVLSLVLYLGALLAYGRFAGFWQRPIAVGKGNPNLNRSRNRNRNSDLKKQIDDEDENENEDEEERKWGAYALALLLFLAAMLAKATAFSLPAVLLLLCWWKRGRIRWRADVVPSLPFFALAMGLGLMMTWLEKNHVGAYGPEWALSFPERCLIAGRSLWFYAGKLLWPASLCFIYPQWHPNTASPWQWLYPLSAIGVIAGLRLAQRRIGRGPLTAILFFAGTLFPVLGFMNAYGMRYSFVWDHWVYLSSLGLIALAAALVVRASEELRQFKVRRAALGAPSAGSRREPRRAEDSAPYQVWWTRAGLLVFGFGAVVLPLLAALTWQQSKMYTNMETLWATILARNPNDFMAHTYVGFGLLEQGRADDAIPHFIAAVEAKPYDTFAQAHLGEALLRKGQVDEAIPHFRRALELQPVFAEACYNLGVALVKKGQADEALGLFQRAIQIQPNFPEAHNDLGTALSRAGRPDEAMFHFRKAVEERPGFAEAHDNLGQIMLQKDQLDEAVTHFQQAVASRPAFAEAHYNLGIALFRKGQGQEARLEFQRALEIQPGFAKAHYNLGSLLLQQGQVDEAVEHLQKAMEIEPGSAKAHSALAAALLRKGQVDEAIAHFEKALQLQPTDPPTLNNLAWLLATSATAARRNGARAVELAQRAERITEGKNPLILMTLGAAYAEAGRFEEAAATVGKARDGATALGYKELAEKSQQMMRLYETRQPYRESRN